MNILGLIPARGGSKGIPNKNLVLLGGRPLIQYTLEAALGSRRLQRLLVSTDDPQIAAFANHGGVPAPFLRPAGLAADDTPMLPVVRHALKWLQDQEGYMAEIVVLLQPTSPLRRAEHIDAAVETLLQTGADTVVSVIPVPHQFNPVSVMSLEEGVLTPYLPGPLILSRQEKPRLFARNGPAVLAVRRQTLESGTLYGPRTSPFLMLPADSVDIDDPEDLSLAEFYLSRRARQNTADKS